MIDDTKNGTWRKCTNADTGKVTLVWQDEDGILWDFDIVIDEKGKLWANDKEIGQDASVHN